MGVVFFSSCSLKYASILKELPVKLRSGAKYTYNEIS